MHFRNLQEYLQYFNAPSAPVEPKRYEEPKATPPAEEPVKEAEEAVKPRRRGRKA